MADRTDPVVYDKSKYHSETVDDFSLPESHASHHTLYFLRWLIDNALMGEEINGEKWPLEEYISGKRTLLSVYEWWDCCLIDDMLSEEGNKFAQHYFGFQRGQYFDDYTELLQGSLPSEYHIEFTDENYGKRKHIIDKRCQQWKQTGKK